MTLCSLSQGFTHDIEHQSHTGHTPESCALIFFARNQTHPLQRILCETNLLKLRLVVPDSFFSRIGTGGRNPHLQFAQSNLQHASTAPISLSEKKKKMTMEREKVIFREDLSAVTTSLLLVFVQQKGWVCANPLAAGFVGD